MAIIVVSVSSALGDWLILIVLNRAGTVYSKKDLPQPERRLTWRLGSPRQARLPTTIINTKFGTQRKAIRKPFRLGKYLVDDEGQIRYLVDPGINGKLDASR